MIYCQKCHGPVDAGCINPYCQCHDGYEPEDMLIYKMLLFGQLSFIADTGWISERGKAHTNFWVAFNNHDYNNRVLVVRARTGNQMGGVDQFYWL